MRATCSSLLTWPVGLTWMLRFSGPVVNLEFHFECGHGSVYSASAARRNRPPYYSPLTSWLRRTKEPEPPSPDPTPPLRTKTTHHTETLSPELTNLPRISVAPRPRSSWRWIGLSSSLRFSGRLRLSAAHLLQPWLTRLKDQNGAPKAEYSSRPLSPCNGGHITDRRHGEPKL